MVIVFMLCSFLSSIQINLHAHVFLGCAITLSIDKPHVILLSRVLRVLQYWWFPAAGKGFLQNSVMVWHATSIRRRVLNSSRLLNRREINGEQVYMKWEKKSGLSHCGKKFVCHFPASSAAKFAAACSAQVIRLMHEESFNLEFSIQPPLQLVPIKMLYGNSLLW